LVRGSNTTSSAHYGQKKKIKNEGLKAIYKALLKLTPYRLSPFRVLGAGQESWPMVMYSMWMLHTETMQDCNKATALVDWIYWYVTWLYPLSRKHVPPPQMIHLISSRLVSLTLQDAIRCNGKPNRYQVRVGFYGRGGGTGSWLTVIRVSSAFSSAVTGLP
jgi:hypothetical protein